MMELYALIPKYITKQVIFHDGTIRPYSQIYNKASYIPCIDIAIITRFLMTQKELTLLFDDLLLSFWSTATNEDGGIIEFCHFCTSSALSFKSFSKCLATSTLDLNRLLKNYQHVLRINHGEESTMQVLLLITSSPLVLTW